MMRPVRTLLCTALVLALAPAAAYADSPASAPTAAPPGAARAGQPIYLDTHYSFAERAADLVSRMTLAEKAAQLQTNNAPAIPRLGVQQYTYWSEGQHGVNRLGADTDRGRVRAESTCTATSFPVNFASTMSWDPELTYKETTAISDEVRGFLDKSLWGNGQNNLGPSASDYGDLTFWAPTVNMDRDPRWGRTNESFGEDTYLASTMAGAFVDGYQGQTHDRPASMTPYLKVAATAKHYALNNDENSRHTQSANTTDANIRDYYTKQFASLVQDAHVSGVMTSYNAVNGTPSPRTPTRWTNSCRPPTASAATPPRTAARSATSTAPAPTAGLRRAGRPTAPVDQHRHRQAGLRGGRRTGLRAARRHPAQLRRRGVDHAEHQTRPSTLGLLTNGVDRRALTQLFTVRMETGEFDPAGKVALHQDHQGPDRVARRTRRWPRRSRRKTWCCCRTTTVSGTSAPLLPVDPAEARQHRHRRRPGEHDDARRLLRRADAQSRTPCRGSPRRSRRPTPRRPSPSTPAAPRRPPPRPRPARPRRRPRSRRRTW